jgi:acyl-coenzyme A thioesterase PaaI-like protein
MTTAPLVPRSTEEQARLDAALVELFERRITFNQTLGLQVLSVRPGDVRGRILMRPELVGHYAYGRLHGGVISATLDAMGGLALMVGIAERHPHDNTMQVMHRFAKMGTIDLRID